MKTNIILVAVLALIIISCQDIINSEDNIAKDLILRKVKALDSLMHIELNPVDFGNVKVRSISSVQVFGTNLSDKDIIVYSIKMKGESGLFQISEQISLPYRIENTSNKMPPQICRIKFVANVINPGIYRDTLILNECEDYVIPIKANVYY